ncbi:AAA-domain-containing protein [Myriangium duriaei CBS 260.36]|uniref:AAA-domain-containing protein n=1 Tax=Myriangium duriaei CBS 260.36 TaxID=1168546 RepID=A0A9P4J0P8_9PEZI|nr:AAA-domain-containing protein [Myriangium duriaei CBS 260.36]
MAPDEAVDFTVRPLPRTNTLDGAFRIHLTTKDLDSLGVKPGELCSLRTAEGTTGTGIAWRSTDANTKTNTPHVKLTDTYRDAFNLKLGNQVSISKSGGKIFHADRVIITDVSELAASEEAKDDDCWAIRCAHILGNVEAIANGIAFEATSRKGLRKRFLIESINSSTRESSSLFFVDDHTKLIMQDESAGPTPGLRVSSLTIISDGIKGLDNELAVLNKILSRLMGEIGGHRLSERHRRQGGVLLCGPSGTGKSLIVDRIASAPWRKVLRIDRGTLSGTSTRMQATIASAFTEALAQQPSVIIMDDLHSIAGSQRDGADVNVADMLVQELDRLKRSRVLVIATAPHPSAVNSILRRPRRLGKELEIPIPDQKARVEILKAIHSGITGSSSDPDFDLVAESIGARTHGYVGADLEKLYEAADDHALDALEDTERVPGRQFPEIILTIEDFEHAMLETRPTAMNEIFVSPPKMSWVQIGGCEDIKQLLSEGFEWSLKHQDVLDVFKLPGDRGVLLYGPPGCSKTMTAQAIAAESGMNFLAVKGGELISMYVGESERAIREVFRKARAAAPSIIFFDEIDAIAGERGSGQSGLNTVTTLLNEMDGIEGLKGVLVLAATNKPETLDPALLRPGRFDNIRYIGPPNTAARRDIFKVKTAGLPIAADVDFDALGAATDGFSGADIAAVCIDATKRAVRNTDAIVPVSAADFEAVLQTARSSIPADMVEDFERWSAGVSRRR